MVGALAAWGSRHVYKRARLVHADCGHEVKLGYHCPQCGARVRGAAVTLSRPGPRLPAGRRRGRGGG